MDYPLPKLCLLEKKIDKPEQRVMSEREKKLHKYILKNEKLNN